ncbi:Uncharacterised protein [Streptococcus pneumoniae]|nr:Uncharacterised protein [Streptococcus pneumoniae]VMC49302.1 Uncharacterised protein [Streptococcus pneumoniae]VNM76796.1 Uncharacterised protein [Streptococcus pneumoniae]VSL54778.1 Uncharacterised protein [Streptococcus pneumoniae]VSL86379.1 Uncharacterised protein [Streptococcus pneumoniae]
MSKMFKCMCLLVMSVFCMSSISPSLVVFADDSLSANSKVVSVRLSLRMAHQCGSEIRK